MDFPFIFLLIGLISGAGASISFAAYRRAKIAASSALRLPPPPDDYKQPEKVKGRDLKKAVEEAVKPHVERAGKLEAELEKTNQLVEDLKTAAQLAPEPKNNNKKKPPAKKQNNNKGSSK